MNANLSAELPKSVGNPARPKSICFVCTGNTCRSPMAAAVANHLGKGKIKAFSAGLYPNVGDPIAKNAILALKKAGIPCTPDNDYEKHRATEISAELIERCDQVIAISSSHMMALICAFPQYAERITVMPTDVPDPFMQSEEVYDACLSTVTECVRSFIA